MIREKAKYYYLTYFKYLVGYFFILLSAFTAFITIYSVIQNSFQVLAHTITIIGSLCFYKLGSKFIKVQSMTNEMLVTHNILHYLRFYFDLNNCKMSEIISMLFFADLIKTIKTDKALYESCEWEVHDKQISCNSHVQMQVEAFLHETSIGDFDKEEEALLSQQMLKDTAFLDEVIVLIKNNRVMDIPVVIDLDKNHKFVMTDYYKKAKNE